MLMAYYIPQFFGRKLVTGENGNNTNGIVFFTGVLQMILLSIGRSGEKSGGIRSSDYIIIQ